MPALKPDPLDVGNFFEFQRIPGRCPASNIVIYMAKKSVWLWLLPLSEVTIVAVMRFEEWIAGLRVDRAYVTYQTCLTQCGYAAETNERLAAANQCDDVSSSCTGAASEGRYRMCRSCLSVSDDWVNLVAYALMAKMSVAVAWVALAAYVIVRNKTFRAFCALFVPMVVMVVI